MLTEANLRPAQRALVEEMTEYPRGIIVLGMGGGKTASALTAHVGLYRSGRIMQSIVLAPARVVDNVWPNEAPRWEHLRHLKVAAVVGTPKQREKLMGEYADVYVVSIDNTQWLIDYLMAHWSAQRLATTQLFIDEVSKFKSPRSVRGKALFKVVSQFAGVWGLTGTPRPNGYEDLWMPIRLVSGDRGVWGTWTRTERGKTRDATDFDTFRVRNFYPVDRNGYRWEPHRHCIPMLDAVAQEWMVRASVDDLNLPALLQGEDFVRYAEMSGEQEARYDDMLNDLITIGRTSGLSGDELVIWVIEAASQGVASGKMTQIVQGFMYRDGQAPLRLKHNPKLDVLLEMDADLDDERAVICYGFREEITQLREALAHRSTALLGGGVSAAEARKTIDDWNEGRIDRLLLHPASAGHGIELQHGGNQMIWYHPTWSNELYDQTVKRLHRPGQRSDVTIWTIAMRKTNDEIKLARVMNKGLDEGAFKEKLRSLVL